MKDQVYLVNIVSHGAPGGHIFNKRKLVLGLQHVKVKNVQMEKFRNIKGLP